MNLDKTLTSLEICLHHEVQIYIYTIELGILSGCLCAETYNKIHLIAQALVNFNECGWLGG